jgi:UDP-glucose 4-epimerase
MENIFKNKVLLITGGTGSVGNAVLSRFLDSDLAEIRIFSRDEKKQDEMRKRYKNLKLSFYIGDVRDASAVSNAVKGVDYIFHAAALKQVPSCEFYPMEAFKTNVVGTSNVIEAAIATNVKKVICLSTDKAVYPINAMGISKAMMEKVAISHSRQVNETVICVTRYGNVMASRGSVIPLFAEQLAKGESITVTDPTMTRFMMTLDDAVNLVIYAFEHGLTGQILVQKSPAASLDVLAKAILKTLGTIDSNFKIIGTRHGEKLFETLLSREEMALAQDLGQYFCIPPDSRDLNYEKFYDEGEEKISNAEDYNSHNTTQLNVDEMESLLLKLPYIQSFLKR